MAVNGKVIDTGLADLHAVGERRDVPADMVGRIDAVLRERRPG